MKELTIEKIKRLKPVNPVPMTAKELAAYFKINKGTVYMMFRTNKSKVETIDGKKAMNNLEFWKLLYGLENEI